MIWHIIPEDDLKPHEEKTTCGCEPKVFQLESGNLLAIHCSYDGREGIEYFNEILNNNERLSSE